MTSDEIRRPPLPVLATIALFALPAVAIVVIALAVFAVDGDPVVLLFILPALLPAATALGLWQGNRGARVVAVLLGVGTVSAAANTPGPTGPPFAMAGLAIILLLTTARSSRAWFAPHH
ncbi:hypothetical protein [Streptomyces sp. NPDC094437]|uniref:hypothetical protein n=1 Tax=Streptomyces sp. NPDC094437 TaxID=3366060 RepID=UPI00381A6123